MDNLRVAAPAPVQSNGRAWERCENYRTTDTGRFIGSRTGQHWSWRPKRFKAMLWEKCPTTSPVAYGPMTWEQVQAIRGIIRFFRGPCFNKNKSFKEPKTKRAKKAKKPVNNAKFLDYAQAPYMAPAKPMGRNLTAAKEEMLLEDAARREAEQAAIIAAYLGGNK